MARVRKAFAALLFLGCYGSARGLAFFGPLLLSRLLAPDTYGGLELALAIATVMGSVVGLGVPQATPRLRLLLGHERVTDILILAFLLSALPLYLSSLASFWLGTPPVVSLTLGLGVLYGAQYSLSFWARVEGYKYLSTWVDNGSLVLLGVSAIVLTVLGAAPELTGFLYGVWGLALPLCLIGLGALSILRPQGLLKLWRTALKEGVPLVLTSLVLVAFAASPRLLAGRFLPLADVGALAFAARLCLIMLVVHQLLMTWHFRDLFTWPTQRWDKIFAGILVSLAVLGVGVMFAWPWVVPHLTPDYPAIPRLVVALIAGQTILWIAIALLESMLNRQGLGRRAAPTLALVGLLGWGAIEALLHFIPPTPLLVAFLGWCLLSIGVGTQWLLLRHSGLVLPRAGLALGVAAVPALIALALGL